MLILGKWVLNALAFLVVANIVPGIHIASFWTALVVALLWGVIGVTLKPLLIILTLPVNILTLGLFTFVINGFFLMLLAKIVEGFEVNGFGAAILGALVLSLLHWFLHAVFRKAALSE
ncbi:MAG: phage holin family protein [Candidatus Moranbacteria bacterium]|nr:phage holin family protein [Candidatus Moranbacteria bacterium]